MFVSLNVRTGSNIEVLYACRRSEFQIILECHNLNTPDHESCFQSTKYRAFNTFQKKSAIHVLNLNYGAQRRAVKPPKTNLKNITTSVKSYVHVDQDLHVFILYMYIQYITYLSNSLILLNTLKGHYIATPTTKL